MGSPNQKLRIGLCSSLCAGGLLACLLSGGLLPGCGPTEPKPRPAGRLKVVMGKTPIPNHPLKEAAIAITRVEVLRDTAPPVEAGFGSSVGDTPLPTRLHEESWVIVQDGEQILDLLELRNGRVNLLANVDVPAGRYTALRLTCKQARVTTDQAGQGSETRTFVMTIPATSTPDVKLNCDFLVASGRETSLLLYVDVNQAFLPVIGDESPDESAIQGFRFSPWSAMRLANLLSAGPSVDRIGHDDTPR